MVGSRPMMMKADDDFIISLRQEFLQESNDLLNAVEQAVLYFESDSSPDHLKEINRCVHCIKGSARAVGYTDYSSLIHDLESLLSSHFEKGLHTEAITLLLDSVDKFKELNAALINEDQSNEKKMTQLIQKILHYKSNPS